MMAEEQFTHGGNEYMIDGGKCYRFLNHGELRPENYEWQDNGDCEWQAGITSFIGAPVSIGLSNYRTECCDPRKPVVPEPPPKPIPFYMVKGCGPTSYHHHNEASATTEAIRLARENPDESFHVLRSIKTIRVSSVEITDHEGHESDDVPF